MSTIRTEHENQTEIHEELLEAVRETAVDDCTHKEQAVEQLEEARQLLKIAEQKLADNEKEMIESQATIIVHACVLSAI